MLSDTEIVDLCSCPDCVRVRTDLMALIERYRGALTRIDNLTFNMGGIAIGIAHVALFPDPAAEEGT
jgi:4-hydroxy-3-methylbut-2-en-1-yl diphosphate synthase IspG/GcpE